MNALRIEIQSQRNQIHIPRPLPIPKQTPLNPIRARHLRQLRRRHRTPPIIMRMQRHTNLLSLAHIPAKILNLVRIHIRRAHLHRRRQIENNRILHSRLPSFLHSLTYPNHEFRARVRKCLGGEFKGPFCACLGGIVFRYAACVFCASDCEFDVLVFSHTEDNSLETFRCRNVDM